MKRLGLLLALFFAIAVQAQNVSVPIVIQQEISSSDVINGSFPALVVANDVNYQGQVLISKGTLVNAQVTITPRKGIGKPGMIDIQVVSTLDVNGNLVALSGCNVHREGKSKQAESIGLAVGLGCCVALPFFFFLCMKGEDVTIPAGTMINCLGSF